MSEKYKIREIGQKHYELTNHLGNVLAVVTDKKVISGSSAEGKKYTETLAAMLTEKTDVVANSTITLLPGFSTNGQTFSATIDPGYSLYTFDLSGSQQYYPFGSVMPGTDVNPGMYKFGFNGKESDKEVKGSGVQYDYGFRIYDARVARFLSVDPLTKDYPWYTPYQYAGNKPIRFIDLDGLEEAAPQAVSLFKSSTPSGRARDIANTFSEDPVNDTKDGPSIAEIERVSKNHENAKAEIGYYGKAIKYYTYGTAAAAGIYLGGALSMYFLSTEIALWSGVSFSKLPTIANFTYNIAKVGGLTKLGMGISDALGQIGSRAAFTEGSFGERVKAGIYDCNIWESTCSGLFPGYGYVSGFLGNTVNVSLEGIKFGSGQDMLFGSFTSGTIGGMSDSFDKSFSKLMKTEFSMLTSLKNLQSKDYGLQLQRYSILNTINYSISPSFEFLESGLNYKLNPKK